MPLLLLLSQAYVTMTRSCCVEQICNCDCLPIELLPGAKCCKPQQQPQQQQKPLPETCQMQHVQSPMRGSGSMELSSMHFPTAS